MFSSTEELAQYCDLPTAEDLASHEQQSLKDAEVAAPSRTTPYTSVETETLSQMIGQRSEITERRTANGLAGMGAYSELQRASNVGNETMKAAKQTRDQGGQEAVAIAAAGQQAVRIEQDKNKNQLLNAVINGVGTGVKTTAGHFGTKMGEGVGNKIFDSGKKDPPQTASTGGTGGSSGGGGGGSGGGGGYGGGSPGGSQVAHTPTSHTSGGGESGGSSGGDGYGVSVDPGSESGYGVSVDPGPGSEYPSGDDYGVSVDPGEYENEPEPPTRVPYDEPPEPPSTPVKTDIPTKPEIICPHCGRPATKLSSESWGFGYNDNQGNYMNRHGSIQNACDACIAAAKKRTEYGQ